MNKKKQFTWKDLQRLEKRGINEQDPELGDAILRSAAVVKTQEDGTVIRASLLDHQEKWLNDTVKKHTKLRPNLLNINKPDAV